MDSRACSAVYETEPMEGAEGRRFLNMCCVGATELSPGEVLDRLLEGERRAGRRRPAPPGAPRTLDLDLLLYGERVIDRPELQVPHPEMLGRAFVLVPLAEVARDWRHPVAGRTVGELASEISAPELERYAGDPSVDFPEPCG